MKRFAVFFFLLPALVLSSCLSHEVAVNTMQPSIATFPAYIKKFVLLDVNGKHGECLSALQLGLYKDSSYSVRIHKSDTALPANFTWAHVAAYVRNDSATGLIVLEKTSVYMRTDPTVATTTQRQVYDQNGQFIRTVTSTKYLEELYYTYQWKIYDLRSRSVTGTFYFEYADSSKWHAGSAFANQLLPHRQWLSRKYYVSGGKNMRSAGFLVRKGQWAKACAMWEREAKQGSPRAKRKAYYNLAIAEEKAGNLPRAIEYATKAGQLGEPQSEFYILILKNELKAMERK